MAKKISLSLLALAVVTAAAFYFLANREVRGQVDDMIARAMESGAYEEITYGSVDMALDGDIHLKELRVVDALRQEYTVEEVIVSEYDLQHEVPWFVNLRASGFRFAGDLPHVDPATAPALHAYLDSLREGDMLPLTVDYRYRYAPEDSYRLDSEMAFLLEDAASGSIRS